MNAGLWWGVGATALVAAAASIIGVVLCLFLGAPGGLHWGLFIPGWLIFGSPWVLASSVSAWVLFRSEKFLCRAPFEKTWLLARLAAGLYLSMCFLMVVAAAAIRSYQRGALSGLDYIGESLLFSMLIGTCVALLGAIPALPLQYLVMRALRRFQPDPIEDSPSGSGCA